MKKLVLTAGVPGSGKGAIIEKIMGDKPQFVLVDPDEIKKDILKDLAQRDPRLKEQMSGDEKWASKVHETSSYLAKRKLFATIEKGMDCIYDSTMGSKKNSIIKFARTMGYRIIIHYIQIDVENALLRAKKREEEKIEIKIGGGKKLLLPGRRVPEEVIRGKGMEIEKNIEFIRKERMVDNIIYYNNDDHHPVVKARLRL